MPFVALAVALLVMSSAPDQMSTPVQAAQASVLPAFDDETYGDRDDDERQDTDPNDPRFNYYYDNEDGNGDEGDSAHGPDDDDGWDLDDYPRSERA
ncbi:hypothetical protein [Hyphomicrobium sp.]|uniref:hypothetical protein n=1 Tax=Hyphomicrobium sp. TaxID=82 RepID=UPI0025C208B8|nr:hypothetical protein [Hyphomicrobium sp.]MCC7252470.1 hypothetical protein [Hyphomicrobium sp.]